MKTNRPTPPAAAFVVNDAVAMLGTSRSSLYNAIKAGKIKPIKFLGRTLIPRSEIERIAASGTD